MEYARFATLMADSYPTYEWEALKIKSGPEGSDKPYELTTFHVWSPADRDLSLGPIYYQHGKSIDATDWLAGATNGGVATQIQMAGAGHDVYLGNNRSTEYS